MRLVLSLLLFVLAANSSFAVLLEGFSDYGAVLDTGAHSVLRYAIPFYGRYADTYQQTQTGDINLYNILNFNATDGDILVGVLHLAPLNQSIEGAVRYLKEVYNTSDNPNIEDHLDILDKIGIAIRTQQSFNLSDDFQPQYAAIWTWQLASSEDNLGWRLQVILATDFIYSFVIFNYCSNELVKPVLHQPTVVVIKDEFPVISSVLSEQIRGLFGVAENRIIGQYIFRVDKIDCSNHPMFYCIIDEPKNFAVTSVTKTSASLGFKEFFFLPTFKIPAILYKLHCISEHGNPITDITFRKTKETFEYPFDNLEPFTAYKCILKKNVSSLPFVGSYNIEFRTKEGVPTAAPSGITFNQLSQTSVEINWNPLPISGRNGNISYEASVTAHKTEEIMYSNANIREERIVVNELAPSAIYKLKIAAKSSSGIGPYASIIFAIGRKVTRVYTDTPTDVVTTAPINTKVTTTSTNTLSTATTENPAYTVSKHSPTTDSPDTATTDPNRGAVTDGDDNTHSTDVTQTTTMLTQTNNPSIPTEPKREGLTESTNDISGLSRSAIIAIAVGGAYTLTLFIIILIIVCVCVYRYKKKRKVYIVTRNSSTSNERPLSCPSRDFNPNKVPIPPSMEV